MGDTIEQYLSVKSGVFGKIYAFEPDEINSNALKHRVERLKKEWAIRDDRIVIARSGVGDKTTKLQMRTTQNSIDRLGTGFLMGSENMDNGVDIFAIDDYFSEQNISFLKADIESFEESMIRGGVKVIRRNKPQIASLYLS